MNWTNPLQRSFNAIKAKLIDGIRKYVPEITDFTENNFLILLISQMSSVAEVLHYYIDNLLRESFFITARKFSSVVKHTQLIDYNIKAASAASVDVTVRFTKDDAYIQIPVDGYTIPKGTIFYSNIQAGDSNDIQFISTKDVIANKFDSYVTVPCMQYTEVLNWLFGPLPDPINAQLIIESGSGLYVEGSMSIEVNPDIAPFDEPWVLVDSFFDSWAESKHFKVTSNINTSMLPAIVFGDGIKGKLPDVNSFVIATYKTTKAEAGNVPENTVYSTNLAIPSWADELEVNNNRPASGGSSYEDRDSVKFHAPLYFRSMEVAVSKRDYEDVAKLVPGVSKAYVDYKCGKFVDIYISPENDGGGNYAVASSDLLDRVLKAVSSRKVITTAIRTFPVGISFINLELTVVGKKGVTAGDIFAYTRDALLELYSYKHSNINLGIWVSDIYAAVDNLKQVDYLNIDSLSITPYIKPGSQSIGMLYLTIHNKTKKRLEMYVSVVMDGSKKVFQLLKYNIIVGTFSMGGVYEDSDISIVFDSNPADYNVNDNWSFKTFDEDANIQIDDNTIPVLLVENLIIKSQETI